MKHIPQMMAAARKDDLTAALENTLGTDGQAWFVCKESSCALNIKGRCTIYTITSPPDRAPGEKCERYEKRA